MSIVSLTNFTLPSEPALCGEVLFDGRTIGTVVWDGENYQFNVSSQAQSTDIKTAQKLHGNSFKKLVHHILSLVQERTALAQAHLKLKRRLKKQTFFIDSNNKLLAIARPYSETVRKYIKTQHPGSLILNTLAEEEAFKRYSEADRKSDIAA